MNKTVKNILRSLLLAVLASILGVNIYLFNAAKLTGDAMPMPFGVGVSVVLTGSMEPEFSAGDLIVVTEADEYVERDIIVFQTNKKAVVHRIVGFEGDMVITQGDANNVADEPIEKSAIKGKVRFSLPLLGYIVLFLKRPLGTLMVCAAAAALFIYPTIMEKRERQAKLAEIRQQIEEIKKQSEKDN